MEHKNTLWGIGHTSEISGLRKEAKNNALELLEQEKSRATKTAFGTPQAFFYYLFQVLGQNDDLVKAINISTQMWKNGSVYPPRAIFLTDNIRVTFWRVQDSRKGMENKTYPCHRIRFQDKKLTVSESEVFSGIDFVNQGNIGKIPDPLSFYDRFYSAIYSDYEQSYRGRGANLTQDAFKKFADMTPRQVINKIEKAVRKGKVISHPKFSDLT